MKKKPKSRIDRLLKVMNKRHVDAATQKHVEDAWRRWEKMVEEDERKKAKIKS